MIRMLQLTRHAIRTWKLGFEENIHSYGVQKNLMRKLNRAVLTSVYKIRTRSQRVRQHQGDNQRSR
jgi:hypothetical protein